MVRSTGHLGSLDWKPLPDLLVEMDFLSASLVGQPSKYWVPSKGGVAVEITAPKLTKGRKILKSQHQGQFEGSIKKHEKWSEEAKNFTERNQKKEERKWWAHRFHFPSMIRSFSSRCESRGLVAVQTEMSMVLPAVFPVRPTEGLRSGAAVPWQVTAGEMKECRLQSWHRSYEVNVFMCGEKLRT